MEALPTPAPDRPTLLLLLRFDLYGLLNHSTEMRQKQHGLHKGQVVWQKWIVSKLDLWEIKNILPVLLKVFEGLNVMRRKLVALTYGSSKHAWFSNKNQAWDTTDYLKGNDWKKLSLYLPKT